MEKSNILVFLKAVTKRHFVLYDLQLAPSESGPRCQYKELTVWHYHQGSWFSPMPGQFGGDTQVMG